MTKTIPIWRTGTAIKTGLFIFFFTFAASNTLAQRSMTEEYKKTSRFAFPYLQGTLTVNFPLDGGSLRRDIGIFRYIGVSKSIAIRAGVDLSIYEDIISHTSFRANGGVCWIIPLSNNNALEFNGNIGYLLAAQQDIPATSFRLTSSILGRRDLFPIGMSFGLYVGSEFGYMMAGAGISFFL